MKRRERTVNLPGNLPPIREIPLEESVQKMIEDKKLSPLTKEYKMGSLFIIVSPPFRKVEVAIRFTDGLSVDTAEEVIEFGKQFKVITGKDGGAPGHYYYDGTKLGENKTLAKLFLYENPDIMAEVTRTIREQMMGA